MDNEEVYLKKAQILKALAHPLRVLIIEELNQGEKCVSDIQKIAGVDFSTVSKHLSVMKTAGLLNMRREHKQVFYTLRTTCVFNFIRCVNEVMKNEMEHNAEIAKQFDDTLCDDTQSEE